MKSLFFAAVVLFVLLVVAIPAADAGLFARLRSGRRTVTRPTPTATVSKTLAVERSTPAATEPAAPAAKKVEPKASTSLVAP